MFEDFKKALFHRPNADERILSALEVVDRDDLRHSRGRNLTDHLCGTRRVLAAWDQPPFIQMAGLCHSIYSTDTFSPQAVPLADRPRVADLIGSKAERLVYLFSVVSRRPLFDSIRAAKSLLPSDSVPICSRPGISLSEAYITGAEAAQLLIVHLANIAEQSSDVEGRPGTWLAQFTYLATHLARSGEHLPPVFESCKRSISRQREQELRILYRKGIVEYGREPRDAVENLSLCCQICPEIAEPRIWLSYLTAKLEQRSVAVVHAEKALALLDQWGTAWDKRFEIAEWRNVAKGLSRGHMDVAEKSLSRLRSLEVKSGIVAASDFTQAAVVPAIGKRSGIGRFLDYLNQIAIDKSRLSINMYPGLPSKELHAPERFSVVSDLEASSESIKEEVQRLDATAFHSEAERIEREGSWKVFMLYEGGRKNEKNCEQCPLITRILENHDCVHRSGGLIYLSRLAPHTHVAAHRGPTNLRVRCHFPIQVPKGDCGMRVGQQVTGWKEGKCLVFDDYFEHEVWNRTEEERIVLLIDLWHPDLDSEERSALEALQWYAYQKGLGLASYWRLNAEQMRKEGLTDESVLPNGEWPNEVLFPIEQH